MKTLFHPPTETWAGLCRRPQPDPAGLDSVVREILSRVKGEGDKALQEYTSRFDKVRLKNFRVSEEEIRDAEKLIPAKLRKAIRTAADNIERFHRPQICEEAVVETMPGVKCFRRSIAIENAGLYVPGGSAPLFSTALMLAIPAKIAGCSRIMICTPPGRDGKASPLVLFAASLADITEICKIGGAQAVAAMAYGTESVPKVEKIFGPGNRFVTRAKEIVRAEGIDIDMPAGPSEVLVIADSSADPAFVAADLLSQAEHGADSQVVLATDCRELITAVKNELEIQINDLPRKETALKSLGKSLLILFSDPDECISFSNMYAPEHLIINTMEADALSLRVRNAGSVFLGRYSCESAGDYASGPNHTLPTGGYAKTSGGVSVDSFTRKITFQEITADGLINIGPTVIIMAEAEKLAGHKNAVSIRLKSLRDVRS